MKKKIIASALTCALLVFASTSALAQGASEGKRPATPVTVENTIGIDVLNQPTVEVGNTVDVDLKNPPPAEAVGINEGDQPRLRSLTVSCLTSTGISECQDTSAALQGDLIDVNIRLESVPVNGVCLAEFVAVPNSGRVKTVATHATTERISSENYSFPVPIRLAGNPVYIRVSSRDISPAACSGVANFQFIER